MNISVQWRSVREFHYIATVTVDGRTLEPFHFMCESLMWATYTMDEYEQEIRRDGVDAFVASFMD